MGRLEWEREEEEEGDFNGATSISWSTTHLIRSRDTALPPQLNLHLYLGEYTF
jgi:hypothetical protein